LVCDLSAVDLDVSREVEGDADALALDGGDPDDPDGVSRVTDDDFLTFTPCDHQHARAPILELTASTLPERTTAPGMPTG
jgi:hypothetical protein